MVAISLCHSDHALYGWVMAIGIKPQAPKLLFDLNDIEDTSIWGLYEVALDLITQSIDQWVPRL